MCQPRQMGFEQTGPAVADQQGLEDSVAAHHRQVVGVKQRSLRIVQVPVEGDHNRHGLQA